MPTHPHLQLLQQQTDLDSGPEGGKVRRQARERVEEVLQLACQLVRQLCHQERQQLSVCVVCHVAIAASAQAAEGLRDVGLAALVAGRAEVQLPERVADRVVCCSLEFGTPGQTQGRARVF